MIMKYDANNRLTNMVDAVGTTTFRYTDFGALLSEDGPWDNDTITYTYTANRLRSKFNLQQPNAYAWEQTYAYDPANRLTNVTSPAGAFGYVYDDSNHLRVRKLTLPIGSYITNTYDSLSRMTGTYLKNSSDTTLNSHAYSYDNASRRTRQTRAGGDYVDYTYDATGELKTATGKESGGTTNRMNEQFGYAYDAGGNLSYRTNGALVETFNVDSLDQLTTISRSGAVTVIGTTWGPATSITVNSLTAIRHADGTFARTNVTLTDGTNTFTAVGQDGYGRSSTDTVAANLTATAAFAYDGNGNLITNGTRFLEYDDENQLIRITEPSSWKSEFSYDGKMRRRIRREYAWQFGAWRLSGEVRSVYDGSLVVQERDSSNLPVLAYTRGEDLSGGLDGAGGIGGLLALSRLSAISPQHYFYHSDGSGNVTLLINSLQLAAAKYLYDPYGNALGVAGPVADSDGYRFSSKRSHAASGVICYLYRLYAPDLQRWQNRDPLREEGFETLRHPASMSFRRLFRPVELSQGPNLYTFVGNDPIVRIDPHGTDQQDDGKKCEDARAACYSKASKSLRTCGCACVLAGRNYPACGLFCVVKYWTDVSNCDDDYQRCLDNIK